jgi:glycogen operon protein
MVRLGTPYPQGATYDGTGVNFAIYSENATSVDIDLFRRAEDSTPYEVITLKERDNFVWHGFVSGLDPGSLYGLRVDGPYKPEEGFRFNKNKLLIDPYARAITSNISWDNSLFGYDLEHPEKDLSFSKSDDAGFMPKCIVASRDYDWRGDQNPQLPWNRTIIYETHVKGISKQREDIEPEHRGTYKGLASPRMISYLKDLGITAVELLPVHHKVESKNLIDKGLHNYWGYDTIGYFAPDSRYSTIGLPGSQINEFKDMVRALHENNIEVILDVVYNHTGEGNHLGPTLSFRGIDNSTYYRLSMENRRFYNDFTGTGNSLDARQPQVLQLIMDSLRYWVLEMHVDGFRFDLAATLARQLHDVDQLSAFFNIIHQDPVISRVKLIAEPWDVGPGGYQVGQFPTLWAEWNGKYRNSMRRYWKEKGADIGEFATRVSGSPDLYETNGRKPHASINYITSHDGFTMYDLVSYSEKHNEANLEGNRDGMDENFSENFGVEGDTDDPKIMRERLKRMRSLIISLLTSQGAPMILGGDEMCRSQKGNNNAYCQDNEVSWYSWDLKDYKRDMLEFTKKMIGIRLKYRVLRRRNFFHGRIMAENGSIKDVVWLAPDGHEMTIDDWRNNTSSGAIGVLLSGLGIEDTGYDEKILEDDLLLLFNPTDKAVEFRVPTAWKGQEILIDSVPENLNRYPIAMDWKVITLEPGCSAIVKEKKY